MGRSKSQLAGTGEKVQYMVHNYNDNTVRFVLHYPGIVDADILCAATNDLIERIDVLHATFLAGKVKARWRVNETYDDSSYFQYIEVEDNPLVTAYSLALIPVAPEGKTQLRVCLVQSSTESAIVLNISHLCVDGSDGKYLLGKLTECYSMIAETGSTKELKVKNGSRAAEQIYEGISKKDYRSLMKNPISTIKSEFPYLSEENGRANMVRATVSEAIMSAARKRAKSEGATANDILLAACYHAYAALPDIDKEAPMSIMSMMDLRRHCKDGDSEGLCNMSGSFITTMEKGIGQSFSDTLSQVVVQTSEAKENTLAGLEGLPLLHSVTRTLPIGVLLQLVGKVYGSFSIGLTNLGNIDCNSLKMGNIIPDGGLFGGPLKKKPGMQISAISFDGACTLSVVGQYTKEDGELLRTMLDRMVAEIEKYATVE